MDKRKRKFDVGNFKKKMSYFLNTGCFVSEEFKNQKNFSYFLNEEFIFSGNRKNLSLPPVKRFPPGFYLNNLINPNNSKVIESFDIDDFIKKTFKTNKPPDIITDLNTNASPFSPSNVSNVSPDESSFFNFDELCDSLIEIIQPKEVEIVKVAKKAARRSPKTSPKNSPKIIPRYRFIYRNKK